MKRPASNQCPEAGFTLVEILAVIMIIAAVAVITIPSLTHPTERLALAKTSKEIMATLRLTRSAAITSNTQQLFTIDVNERTFGSSTIAARHFPEMIAAAFKVAEPERQSQYRGGIRFFPDGSSTGGELALSSNERKTMLCVHWLTGRTIEAETCQ